ncbi:MAG: SRPBCC domain-containing protein [Caulobacteraceae bacterium]|nr:SRPBCC domain-containing protein [Caulobacteraceae bacterium]
MSFDFQTQLKIRKPPAEVFDGVVDPKKLAGYFVKDSSGPLAAGTTVQWSFAEAPEPFDVVVDEVVKNERIVFRWPAVGETLTTVEMVFKPLEGGHTMVQIAERGWPQTSEGQKQSYSNAGGWMHMMLCLKGYLEYGVNLREGGAF